MRKILIGAALLALVAVPAALAAGRHHKRHHHGRTVSATCRSHLDGRACLTSRNRSSGDTFRFVARSAARRAGEIRFGSSLKDTVDRPPFETNGTGLVENLNADAVDGRSAHDIAGYNVAVAALGNEKLTTDGVAGRHTAEGLYDVVFPEAVPPSSCVYQATINGYDPGLVTTMQKPGDPTHVQVRTFKPDGTSQDRAFFLTVRCD